MLKESIRGTFFAIQANFCFNDMNFTDAKIWQGSRNQQKQFVQKTIINRIVLYSINKKDNS